MTFPPWRDVIIRALYALGGDAPYSQLKPEIERRAERPTKGKWRQTVEGTIEQFSSDSIRGIKRSNFRGSDRDIFIKLGHGHWGIRNPQNPFVRKATARVPGNQDKEASLADKETPTGMVFVHEHWRRYPGEAESDEGIEAVQIELAELKLGGAWVTSTHLEVEFQNGFGARFPLAWFPTLLQTKTSERSSFELANDRITWPHLRLELTTAKLFLLAASRR